MRYNAAVILNKARYLRVSRVVLITLFCAGFVSGIGLVAENVCLNGFLWLAFATLLLFVCHKRLMFVAVPLAIFSGAIFGIYRGGEAAGQIAQYSNYFEQKVTVVGRVSEDTTYKNNQLVMMLDQVSVDGQGLPGKVRVTIVSALEPSRGDIVQAYGKLYDGFSNYQASMYYANATILQKSTSPVNSLRQWFTANIRNLLPDTQAGLGLGFLLGVKSQLSDTLYSELKVLGLTHIVVASGYNLTILVRLSRRLFAKLSHFQATAASFLLIAGFVSITGFSASMSRAALVTSLSLLAFYYGRKIHPVLLLTFSAAVTAAINPLYVWGDIGWWLSFLAFTGVLVLAPLLQSRIFKECQPKLLGQIVLETICAQIATLPLILLIFGNLSVLSLVANVLVVPLIPLAMLFTFCGGLIGMLCPLFAWPAIWLLDYICQVVHFLSGVSWASVEVSISTSVFIAIYALICIVAFVLWRVTKYDYLSKSMIEYD